MMKKSLIASAVALGLGVGAAQAAQVGGGLNMVSDSANFTMLQPNGAIQGGTNDVAMTWDQTVFTSITDYTGPGSISNVTAVSTTLFSSNLWTAHDIQAFGTGTYTFDVTLGAGTGTGGGGNPTNDNETGTISMTIPTGQLGIHMLFDWNGNHNIDVAVVAGAAPAAFGSGLGATTDGVTTCGLIGGGTGSNCLWDGAGFGSDGQPLGSQVWQLVSIDPDGDGTPGIPMAAGGPFQFFNGNFNANLTPVPIPAAVWLFGSGLMGLVGVARRRKKA